MLDLVVAVEMAGSGCQCRHFDQAQSGLFGLGSRAEGSVKARGPRPHRIKGGEIEHREVGVGVLRGPRCPGAEGASETNRQGDAPAEQGD